MTKTRAFVTALALAVMPGGLAAQTVPLKDVAEVRDGIIYVGMAYEISEKCDGINARIFRGIGYLQSLKNRARALGYADADIDAYVNDSDEKRRLEQIARDQLVSLGVIAGQPATYCAVGRAQMDAGTRVGWLLR